MIDFLFMEFYIKKKYGIPIQEYFKVNIATVSKWRVDDKIPSNRILYFIENEGSINRKELLDKLY
jgi:hypothetical protein